MRRRADRKRWLAGALAVCGLAMAACDPPDRGGAAAPEPGTQPAPEFDLEQLGGGQVALASLRGRIVIVDFWATWCPPCEFQVPELNKFFDAHRDDADVALFGISVDTDAADVVGAWASEKEVRYPVLLAGGDDVARRYGAVGFPTLVVIDAGGAIDSVHVGLIELDDLEDVLARLRDSS